MHPCTQCNFKAKNKAGLSSHLRRHKILAMQAEDNDDSTTVAVANEPAKMPAVAASAPAPAPAGNHAQNTDAHVCKDCHHLPIGSVELVGLLLVLVFALSAVLLTSIYVIETQM